MKIPSRRSSAPLIPGYGRNAVLQLIVASFTGFILYHFTRVAMLVFGATTPHAYATVTPFVGLPAPAHFATHCWTLLTYGWVHNGFFECLSNMIWLYCFGSVVQTLVGFRQVIPVYIYGLLAGGILFMLTQLIPAATLPAGAYVMTGQAGIMALAAATVTISPRYRFHLGESFSIPLLVVFAIYLVVSSSSYGMFGSPFVLASLALGGMAAGSVTMLLLKNGYQPGAWMYHIAGSIQHMATPDEETYRSRNGSRRERALSSRPGSLSRQKHLDDILDKINQRGYRSLSAEEREFLLQASKEGGRE